MHNAQASQVTAGRRGCWAWVVTVRPPWMPAVK
jgi:hypothetical protein